MSVTGKSFVTGGAGSSSRSTRQYLSTLSSLVCIRSSFPDDSREAKWRRQSGKNEVGTEKGRKSSSKGRERVSFRASPFSITLRFRDEAHSKSKIEERAMWGKDMRRERKRIFGHLRFFTFSNNLYTPTYTRQLLRARMGKRALRALDEEYDPLKQRPTKRRTTAKDPASDSDSSQATKTSTGQRKGGRTRVACDQCSKRRSRCSLEGPVCDSCQRRDEPCSYESLIWM